MIDPKTFLSSIANISAVEAEFSALAEQRIDAAIAAATKDDIIVVPGAGRELYPSQLTPALYALTLRRLALRYADLGWLIAIGPLTARTMAVLATHLHDERFREAAMEHACVVI